MIVLKLAEGVEFTNSATSPDPEINQQEVDEYLNEIRRTNSI